MEIWETVAVILGGFLLVTDVILRIAALKNKAVAPELEQNRRITALEEWRKGVDRALDTGDKHFGKIDAYIEVTAISLLALLDHGIQGNNLASMEEAKKQLTEYIVHK